MLKILQFLIKKNLLYKDKFSVKTYFIMYIQPHYPYHPALLDLELLEKILVDLNMCV